MILHVRRPWANFLHLNVLGLEDRIESVGELGIVISQQVRGLVRLILENDRHVASLLRDPGICRIWCYASQVDSTRPHLDEEQHEVIYKAASGPDLLLEEVAGPQGLGVACHELGPGSFATRWPGVEAIASSSALGPSALMLAN